jgi:hypothetical protein
MYCNCNAKDATMKTASLPSLRVDSQLRQDTESVLREGESLSQFIESAVRDQVALRKAHAEFLTRGLAARDRARQSGQYVSAEQVLGQLQQRLHAAKATAVQKAEPRSDQA